MRIRDGIVVDVPREGKVKVAVRPQPLKGNHVGAQDPDFAVRDDPAVFEVANTVGAEVGDTVLLVAPDRAGTHHFLPFVGLIAIGGLLGLLIFRLVDNQWAFSAYAGALVWWLALVPGAAVAAFFLRRSGRGGGFAIDRVLKKTPPPQERSGPDGPRC